MKMKKLVMIAALTAVTMGLNAQSLMVESAVQDLRKGSLKKAKTEIDAAAVNEKTKDDAKTWYYRSLIYAEIGRDAQQTKPKYKDLAPNWADLAYESALECKRLDTKNDGEFTKGLISVFSTVGYDFYTRSRKLFEEKNYTEAMQVASRAAEMYNNGGEGDNAGEAMFVAGLSAVAAHDTANIKKFFNNLMRKRTDKEQVYTYLFNVYKAEGNVDQAMKVASNYQKSQKNNYKAYLLLAEGYLLNQNIEKGKEVIGQALDLTKDSANIYPDLLNQAGALLELTNDMEGAQARYQESLTLKPVQFGANFNMGKMFYNRAVDKLQSAPEPDPFNEATIELADKLEKEARDLFGQAITYLEKSVEFIDNMPEGQDKQMQRPNLANALSALSTAYARVERYNESKAAHERYESLLNQ
jgi:Tfp pilus assembly protein PilF